MRRARLASISITATAILIAAAPAGAVVLRLEQPQVFENSTEVLKPGETTTKHSTLSYSKDKLLVRVARGFQSHTFLHSLGVSQIAAPGRSGGWGVAYIQPGGNLQAIQEKLKKQRGIVEVLRDPLLQITSLPNDPAFGLDSLYTWGLYDIGAPATWSRKTSVSDHPIGIIDTGIDLSHPDLQDNIWTNPGEIADNGIDDDGNGYIDDIHGWDFYDNDNSPQDEVESGVWGGGHGTHVAGIVAARGDNNIGTAGVNWQASLIGLRACSAKSSCSLAAAVAALNYAAQKGVRVTNNSYGGATCNYTALRDTIAANPQMLFVAAAGNDSSEVSRSFHSTCPAGYDLDNIIAVAANSASPSGGVLWFSNWGDLVDLSSPGYSIYSTLPEGAFNISGGYGMLNGTSMAAPFVTGAAAMVAEQHPAWDGKTIRRALDATAQDNPVERGRTLTGSRLDLDQATSLQSAPPALLSVSHKGTGEGSVLVDSRSESCDPNCLIKKPEGSDISLVAQASSGSQFVDWKGGCKAASYCKNKLQGIDTAWVRFNTTTPGDNWVVDPILSPFGPPLKPEADLSDSTNHFFNLSISDDSNTRVIGIYNHPCFIKDSSRITVQRKQAGQWVDDPVSPATPFTSDVDPSGYCLDWGIHTRLSGDGNTLLVTRPASGSASGVVCTAYIYRRKVSQWRLIKKLMPPRATDQPPYTPSDTCGWFGWTAHLSADGHSAAFLDVSSGTGYVDSWQENPGGQWSNVRTTLPETTQYDWGWQSKRSIALSDDGSYMAVARPYYISEEDGADGIASNLGRIYIYHREDQNWQLQQTIDPAPPEGTTWSFMGSQLDLSVDGDLLIASVLAGTKADPEQGVSLIFKRQGGVFRYLRSLRSSTGLPGLYCTIATTKDRIVCGSPNETVGYNKWQGAIYTYDAPDGWDQDLNIRRAIAPQGSQRDAMTLASAPSINSDGTLIYSQIQTYNIISGDSVDSALGYSFSDTTSRMPKITWTGKPDLVTFQTDADFSFTGESGASFECLLDYAQWQDCTGSLHTTSLSRGYHTLQVRQKKDGQQPSTPAVYTWMISSSAPAQPSILSRPDNISSRDSATFTFSEPGELQQCQLDGAEWEDCTSPKTYTGLADGHHTFHVVAQNSFGVKSNISEDTWDSDTSAPVWITPPSLLYSGYTRQTMQVANVGLAFDPHGVTYSCSLDGGLFVGCSFAKLSAGPHSIVVLARDDLQHSRESSSILWWFIDTRPPAKPSNLTRVYPLGAVTRSARVHFSFQAAEDGGLVQCRLDNADWEQCTTNNSYQGIVRRDGSHRLQVRQIDQAGNTSQITTSPSWTLDRVAPRFQSLVLYRQRALRYQLKVRVGEAGRLYYQWESGAWRACKNGTVFRFRASGVRTLHIRADDSAGNRTIRVLRVRVR